MSVAIGWLSLAVALCVADLLLGTIYILILGAASLVACLFAFFSFSFAWQVTAFSLSGIAGCLVLSLNRHKGFSIKRKSALELQHINDGNKVHVHHWNPDRTTNIFYRGTTWEAVAKKGEPLLPGVWSIVGMNGNTLIISLLQES